MNACPKKLVAEAIGTFSLVFAGTSAIVLHDGGVLSHAAIALTFGLVVFAMIAALGGVSGAHLNPAVTMGVYLAKRFPGQQVAPYILSQCSGAVLASLCVWTLFPTGGNLGATIPAGPIYQSWVLEVMLTATLMSVILWASTATGKGYITAGLAIGATVAFCALLAGPVSGASMNPARSLGPALVTGQLEALWIYLTAPFIGVALAVGACRCVRSGACCRPVALGGSD